MKNSEKINDKILDENNKKEINMNMNYNKVIKAKEYEEFNSKMLLPSGNQLINNNSLQDESLNTVSIIENKNFMNKDKSNIIDSNIMQNNINNFKVESRNNFNFSNIQRESFPEQMANPFFQPRNTENNNNINLITNQNQIQSQNILNKRNYIYNIYGNLYSYFKNGNPNNEDNIIISDLNNNIDFQNNINNHNNNYGNINSQFYIQNNQIN